ncbi:MAG: fibronectin type III domain-containing protein [bacterium]
MSDPLSIQNINSFYHPYRPCYIDVFEDYAYTGDGYDNRVTLIDISNPANPTVKASYLTTGWVWSVFVKYCLICTEGPKSPSDLNASGTTSGSAILSWIDNSGIEQGLKIYREVNDSGTYTELAEVGRNVTSYTEIGLSPGTNYCYKIKAYNACGESGWSNILCAVERHLLR